MCSRPAPAGARAGLGWRALRGALAGLLAAMGIATTTTPSAACGLGTPSNPGPAPDVAFRGVVTGWHPGTSPDEYLVDYKVIEVFRGTVETSATVTMGLGIPPQVGGPPEDVLAERSGDQYVEAWCTYYSMVPGHGYAPDAWWTSWLRDHAAGTVVGASLVALLVLALHHARRRRKRAVPPAP